VQKDKARSRHQIKALEEELSRMKTMQEALSRKIKASNEVSCVCNSVCACIWESVSVWEWVSVCTRMHVIMCVCVCVCVCTYLQYTCIVSFNLYIHIKQCLQHNYTNIMNM